jgi:hypothetical protein
MAVTPTPVSTNPAPVKVASGATAVSLTSDEIAAISRIMSLFFGGLVAGQTLTPAQVMAIDYLLVTLPKSITMHAIDNNYSNQLRSRIDAYSRNKPR